MVDLLNLEWLAEASKKTLQAIRNFAHTLRRGPRELSVAAFGVLCFMAPKIIELSNQGHLLREWESYLILFYLLGTFSFLWIFLHSWRIAIPILTPPLVPGSVVIKGPGAFGAQDGILFRRLGRESELHKLYDYVLDDAVSVVVLVGESGAGKTSLLRAGLSNLLEEAKIGYVYWEAVPSAPGTGLLHAIRNAANAPALREVTCLLSLLKRYEPGGRSVIALDQFEQLREGDSRHEPIFELLRNYVRDVRPPHRLTWIIAFRRDFEADWRDFEAEVDDFNPRRISLRLFTVQQAQDVMATIASEAGFSIGTTLLADLTNVIARDGRISPVDIGITMLGLHELARGHASAELTAQQYQLAGGADGLLTNYLQQSLERFTSAERDSLLLAMLSLADPLADRRLAEGKTEQDLASAAQMPQGRLHAMLAYLAAPAVRVLETWSPPEGARSIRYRIPHERLIVPIRRLSGRLTASADRALLDFQQALQTWTNGKKLSRYLLSGSDLRRMRAHRDMILSGIAAGESAQFFSASIRRQRHHRAAGVALVTLMAVAAPQGLRLYTDQQNRQMLAAWGLPADLYDRQLQINELNIDAPITSVDWIRSSPLSLGISSDSPHIALSLPPSLQELSLSLRATHDLTTLHRLPNLTTFSLYAPRLVSLVGIENMEHLHILNLRNLGIESLAGIQPMQDLTTLSLRYNANLENLEGINKLPNLTSLDIGGGKLRTLSGIEGASNLKSLTIENVQGLSNLAGIEKLWRLRTLIVKGNQDLTDVSSIAQLRDLEVLNVDLVNLGTGENKTPSILPFTKDLRKLRALTITADSSLTDLASLSYLDDLASLRLIGNSKLHSLSGIEFLPQLVELSITGSLEFNASENQYHPVELRNLENIEALSQLRSLEISNLPRITKLKLPKTVTELHITGTAGALQGMENLDSVIKLWLGNYIIDDLTDLGSFKNVEHLYFQSCNIKNITSLVALTKLMSVSIESGSFGANLTELGKLGQLSELVIKQISGIADLRSIENLHNLSTLHIGGIRVSAWPRWEGLRKLLNLELSGTDLNDLGTLGELRELRRLDLDDNPKLTNLGGLQNLEKLSELGVFNIGPTADLTHVRRLQTLQKIRVTSQYTPTFHWLPDSVKTMQLGDIRVLEFSMF